MALSVGEQVRYWSVGLVVFIALVWLLSAALLPFVLGAAIAYLTDPWADWLEDHGFSRIMATVVITLGALGVGTALLILVIPVFVDQIQQAIEYAPTLIEQTGAILNDWLPTISAEKQGFLDRTIDKLREKAEGWSVSIVQQLWEGSLAVVNFLAVMVVTPVVAFYLLVDWDKMVSAIDDYLPRDHRPMIRRLASQLDDVLAGFVRGQLTVCMILGVFYAVALSAVGLSFGLVIGVIAGLISFIPFVGSIVGGALSIGVALVQFWGEPEWVIVVAAIFLIGQAVEGNFLTPKLVGGKVGLHPVWLMFSLSAFGVLFGFLGLLIAVPAAAMIGVIGRFFLEQYKGGRLYQGARAWRSPSESGE